jgi:hypothetical protein
LGLEASAGLGNINKNFRSLVLQGTQGSIDQGAVIKLVKGEGGSSRGDRFYSRGVLKRAEVVKVGR